MKKIENLKLMQITFFLTHVSIFIIFVWFGFLKIIDVSPANSLVGQLLSVTMPWIPIDNFIIGLGLFEMLTGILFIIPRTEKLAVILLIPHMATTFLPLVLLPDVTWSGFLIPTLEGQYIIKNLAIIAVAASVMAGFHFAPRKITKKK